MVPPPLFRLRYISHKCSYRSYADDVVHLDLLTQNKQESVNFSQLIVEIYDSQIVGLNVGIAFKCWFRVQSRKIFEYEVPGDAEESLVFSIPKLHMEFNVPPLSRCSKLGRCTKEFPYCPSCSYEPCCYTIKSSSLKFLIESKLNFASLRCFNSASSPASLSYEHFLMTETRLMLAKRSVNFCESLVVHSEIGVTSTFLHLLAMVTQFPSSGF